MKLALELLGVITVLELVIWLPGIWRIRKVWASIDVLLLASVSGAIVGIQADLWSALLLLVSIYRIFNQLRIIENRMNEQYLRSAVRRTSLTLVGLQVLVLVAWLSTFVWQLHAWLGWIVLLAMQIIVALVLAVTTLYHLRTTRPPQLTEGHADHDMPTVTVAVPARNETEELADCLRSILSSDYPKLEVLVLDDCSQDKTSDIIRSFAHDGVRFIGGKEPRADWLAKNQAYQRLYEESNGEIILFCGVDVRFEPSSIRALVDTMLQENKTMLNVIPANQVPKAFSQHDSLLVQPMRYAWEFSLPRGVVNRPPALSTCWLINKDMMVKAGGFAAVSRNITPQSYFAGIATQGNGYGFLRSDKQLAVYSTKSFEAQRATAVRTRYPQAHRRPEQVLLISLGELAFILSPFVLLAAALLSGRWQLAAIATISCTLLELCYVLIVTLTYRRFLVRSVFALPFASIFDIALLNVSMWKYEFSEVVWKGRNICLPVMRVLPRLPKLE